MSAAFQREIRALDTVRYLLVTLAVVAFIAGIVAGALVANQASDLELPANDLWISALTIVSFWFIALVAALVGAGVVRGIQGLLLGQSVIDISVSKTEE